ncbi:hypothetical protein SLEP1_g27028 [Rubroshorea leprosula]|uniref:Trichome birefringence-like C-terminal domain-containing protein n=1 Tax=Rubroshorea leprosula TaxID=152421 RepID=A0AAV5JRY1_9ROSI|nr:hypothetical protein SLEP1_g27028 [Rubroshorea leprosula]
MVCLVQSVILEEKKSFHRIPPTTTMIFKAEEYNASIEYHWVPFMVDSDSYHATYHTVLR